MNFKSVASTARQDGTVFVGSLCCSLWQWRREFLAILVERYETEHFPIAEPDPIGFLAYLMESRC